MSATRPFGRLETRIHFVQCLATHLDLKKVIQLLIGTRDLSYFFICFRLALPTSWFIL
jgi:hypothetical protein